MESTSRQCFLGQYLQDSCDSALTSVNELTDEEQELILWRSNSHSYCLPDSYVCVKHKDRYLCRFSLHKKICCDPFKRHKRSVLSGLREVSLEKAKDFKIRGFSIVPGEKMCPTCTKLISEKQASDDSSSDDINVSNVKVQTPEKAVLNTSLTSLGISPAKLHSVARHSLSVAAKCKLELATGALKTKISHVYQVELATEASNNPDSVLTILEEKAKHHDELMDKIKQKIKHANNREKIQLLTLVPQTWSRQKASSTFQVSEYLVRQVRGLVIEKGILSMPEQKRGKTLPHETVQKVKSFYLDDENSRIMPGKKDKVSTSKNTYEQKRLVLSNLAEMYSLYKKKYPEEKVGFSKFASLRPKQCIPAGSSGTHTVCVCTYHQNVKLLVNAISIKETYHDLIKIITCDINNRACMLRLCDKCPPSSLLQTHLENEIEDYDPDEMVQYSQWVSTYRMTLNVQITTLSEFCDTLIKKIEKLTPHSFIAQSQSFYLKMKKETLDEGSVLILMVFSENLNFVIQDKVQVYHWNNGSCTLHTVVIYT